MADRRRQIFIGLLLVIFPAAAVLHLLILHPATHPPVALESRVLDTNPDKFYLEGKNGMFSYAFTYDPHEADAWMFRTAEGTMVTVDRNFLISVNAEPR